MNATVNAQGQAARMKSVILASPKMAEGKKVRKY